MNKKIEFSIRNIIIVGIIFCILAGSGAYIVTTYALTENGYPIHSEKVEYTDSFNLGATNVQAAINRTCTKIDEKLDGIYGLKLYTIKSNFTLSSGYASIDISAVRDDGLVPRAIAGVSFNSTYYTPVGFMLNVDQTVTVNIRHIFNSSSTEIGTVYVRLLYY